jgi:hypothetical protein
LTPSPCFRPRRRSPASDDIAPDGGAARRYSNAEISRELYISDTTVKTHITHILQKLNLRDRVQAVVLAYETGLFEADGRPPGTITPWSPGSRAF